MNAPLRPELLLQAGPTSQPTLQAALQAPLPLAAPGVLRQVWEGRWGSMLIEVVGDQVFVNGQRVEPHVPHVDRPA
jgi:hypothetical protein